VSWIRRVTLDDLPTLTISSVGEQSADAIASDQKWIGEKHIVCILIGADHFVWGRLMNVEKETSRCTFVPFKSGRSTTIDATKLPMLQVGRRYPLFDGYWGERAELALNRLLEWREREYVAPDAVWFERSRTMRPFSGDVPEGGVLVKSGWDHEHCQICWETISQQTNPVGVFAEPDYWICKDCYSRFVLPRSLDFIVDAPPRKPWWKFWRKGP
jgi:hypothetical protein